MHSEKTFSLITYTLKINFILFDPFKCLKTASVDHSVWIKKQTVSRAGMRKNLIKDNTIFLNLNCLQNQSVKMKKILILFFTSRKDKILYYLHNA